jgi:hypothetical protein
MDLTKLDRKLLAVLEQKAPVVAKAILPLVLDSDPDGSRGVRRPRQATPCFF